MESERRIIEEATTARELPRGLHLHFDAFSGIAGDMTVAALVDAGVPERIVREAVDAMNVPGLSVAFTERRSHSLVGKAFQVHSEQEHGHAYDDASEGEIDRKESHPADDGHLHDHELAHDHRDYREIRKLLRAADLSPATRSLAERIFHRLAQAEAKIHGLEVDRVTFHEVGAYDSIADIVGIAAALAYLEPSSVSTSPPVLGSGTVETAHGLLPVPAPATVELLLGIPAGTGGDSELTTPTGAALLATVAETFGPPPSMKIVSQGFGVGDRTLADRPNVLRVLLGIPIREGESHD